MTFFQLMRRNAWRKRLRAILLMFSVGVAFLIYGLTASFVSGSQGAAGASDDLLGVFNRSGRGLPLPLAYLHRIAAEGDVAAVAYTARMRGFVEVEKNVVAVSAVDPRAIAAANGAELGLTPDLIAALEEGGDRVLVGRALAEAQGWSIGQRIGVTSQIVKADGNRNWSFTISGIFDGADASTDTYFMLARCDMVNAARARDNDTVDAFVVRPREGVSSGVLAARIDALFANSVAQTRTQSEKQFLEAFLRQFADVGLIVSLVVGAAFVTILMISVNTMLFAISERRFEIGVMKVLGFSRGRIVALILGETLFIFAVGGAGGLILAKLATLVIGPEFGLVFSREVLLKSAAIIAGLGLLTGLLPAVNAMRLPIVNAFRTR
ncbi:putative ABC transport system permease protein [Rhizobium leguminosarum]|uniref:ABC transport system permease protein n=1 Tax=Rhizobium leguminosarum TaxID=384 RepID=A0AAE2MI76_RHILE|nr:MULTISPECIES: FtsX-like permease family protein [Rhizobium]MBB4289794.1 putative ABC transport system permease protein [Rhizobium leguminosarum]MBB4296437.1 putative ABC transport system permease protein [Rhizobium leguminosarum]MBB4308302.1 putative ABC transport system permease protein [Rhizobium leguminosarum]MBB4416139.1 putative ABC transport system permease protein [Rhizobium leguminosarum]MBB4430895.1 putative ABC transport system permease protein [Rhizobium esperanzae]